MMVGESGPGPQAELYQARDSATESRGGELSSMLALIIKINGAI